MVSSFKLLKIMCPFLSKCSTKLIQKTVQLVSTMSSSEDENQNDSTSDTEYRPPNDPKHSPLKRRRQIKVQPKPSTSRASKPSAPKSSTSRSKSTRSKKNKTKNKNKTKKLVRYLRATSKKPDKLIKCTTKDLRTIIKYGSFFRPFYPEVQEEALQKLDTYICKNKITGMDIKSNKGGVKEFGKKVGKLCNFKPVNVKATAARFVTILTQQYDDIKYVKLRINSKPNKQLTICIYIYSNTYTHKYLFINRSMDTDDSMDNADNPSVGPIEDEVVNMDSVDDIHPNIDEWSFSELIPVKWLLE